MGRLYKMYREGDGAQAWLELRRLDALLRSERRFSDAVAVCRATVDDFCKDVIAIVDWLRRAGFRFYDAETCGIRLAGDETRRRLAEKEATFGPLPLVLTALYAEVASVSLCGYLPGLSWHWELDGVMDPDERRRARKDGLRPSPLSIVPLHIALPDDEADGESRAESGRRWLCLSEDDAGKAGLSGAEAWCLQLPSPGADAWLGEDGWLVDRLWEAVEEGGFPGWARHGAEPDVLRELKNEVRRARARRE